MILNNGINNGLGPLQYLFPDLEKYIFSSISDWQLQLILADMYNAIVALNNTVLTLQEDNNALRTKLMELECLFE
jgi:hypothetical protein